MRSYMEKQKQGESGTVMLQATYFLYLLDFQSTREILLVGKNQQRRSCEPLEEAGKRVSVSSMSSKMALSYLFFEKTV